MRALVRSGRGDLLAVAHYPHVLPEFYRVRAFRRCHLGRAGELPEAAFRSKCRVGHPQQPHLYPDRDVRDPALPASRQHHQSPRLPVGAVLSGGLLSSVHRDAGRYRHGLAHHLQRQFRHHQPSARSDRDQRTRLADDPRAAHRGDLPDRTVGWNRVQHDRAERRAPNSTALRSRGSSCRSPRL